MKKQILTLIAFAGTALAGQGTMEVKVPFAFTAGPATLPAGTYTIEELGSNYMLFRGADKSAFVIDKTPLNGDSSGKYTLRFGRTAGGYVLDSIQPAAEVTPVSRK